MKFFKKIKLFWQKRIIRKPYNYAFVKEGIPVGPELVVAHLTFHDITERACCCRLTEEQILKKLDANAIKIIDFKRIDETCGITTFQPCKV